MSSAPAPPPEGARSPEAVPSSAPPGGERTAWVGRAKPPPAPPPPADPYWPPVEQAYAEPYVVYAPPPRRRAGMRVLLVLGGLLAACVLGGVIVAVMNAANRDTATPQSPDVTTTQPAPTPTSPGVGSTVTDGQFDFVVNSVTCGRSSLGGLIKVEARGQFCIVDLTVTNTGDEGRAFTEGLQKAHDADGNEYSTDIFASAVVNEGFGSAWSDVQPDAAFTGKIVYDIPADAAIADLELHESLFSAGAIVTVAAA